MERDIYSIATEITQDLDTRLKNTQANFKTIWLSGARAMLYKYAVKDRGRLYTPDGGKLLDDEIKELEEDIRNGVYRV